MRKYHYFRDDFGGQFIGVFTKDYKVGDIITWLGHDGVFGYLCGEDFICTQEHFDSRGNHPVYKRVGLIHLKDLPRYDYQDVDEDKIIKPVNKIKLIDRIKRWISLK